MSQIQKANDPKARQRLLQEHQAMMQNGMGMMGWDQMRGHYSNLTPEQMKERQYMLDQHMGMQQMMMMMGQMMQHQYHMGMPPR